MVLTEPNAEDGAGRSKARHIEGDLVKSKASNVLLPMAILMALKILSIF